MKKETLLSKWIEIQIKSHPEPSREGTPRGEKIGISKKKFEIALRVATTNFTLKEIAERNSVSYDLIRQWASESDFKKIIDESYKQYSKYVIKFLEEKAEDPNIEKFFDDTAIYSDNLVNELADYYSNYFIENFDINYDKEGRLFTSGFMYIVDILFQGRDEEKRKTLFREFIHKMILKCTPILSEIIDTRTSRKMKTEEVLLFDGLLTYVEWYLDATKK